MVYESFKKRQQRKRGEFEFEHFRTEGVTDRFLLQMRALVGETFGETGRSHTHTYGNKLLYELSKEHQELCAYFAIGSERRFFRNLSQFFSDTKDLELVLSVVELALLGNRESPNFPDRAEVFRIRLRENGYGYDFIPDTCRVVVRTDEVLHQEAIVPAFNLLHEQKFEAANDAYMKAHDHFKAGRFREAIVAAAQAFEGVLKKICDDRGWDRGNKNAAGGAIGALRRENFFDGTSLENFVAHLEQLLVGVGSPRNSESGAHLGPEGEEPPEYMVHFVLNSTAATIVMLLKHNETH